MVTQSDVQGTFFKLIIILTFNSKTFNNKKKKYSEAQTFGKTTLN
jgi:hypothetical protein